MVRVEIAAERLRPFAADAPPGLAAVVGEVEAAGGVAVAGVGCAQQEAPTVAEIDGEILGIEQRFGGIDLFPRVPPNPRLASVGGTGQPDVGIADVVASSLRYTVSLCGGWKPVLVLKA